MRILHADTDDLENPLRGGQPVRTFEINSRLAHEHDITVLTASYKGSQPQVSRGRLKYQRLGVTVPGWGLSSHLSFLARLPGAVKRMPHDLVVEEFTPPFGFCGLQRHTDKPVVSIVQWFFFDDWQRRYHLPFEAMMRKRARAIDSRNSSTRNSSARNIIVQTDRMGSYFQALMPNSIVHKIPCGIAEQAFVAEPSSGDYALFLGRLDIQHKGLDDLLAAWQALQRQHVSIPLWIVGAGKEEAMLKAMVATMQLQSVVIFKGRLEGAQKQAALRNCRFLMMPSRQETFGLTALEAMASGKPVIAYDIDHLNEVLKPAWSTLVLQGDIAGLANAAIAYWRKPELALTHGAHALNEAKNYKWDKLADMQNEVYRGIIKNENRTISALDIPARRA